MTKGTWVVDPTTGGLVAVTPPPKPALATVPTWVIDPKTGTLVEILLPPPTPAEPKLYTTGAYL